MAEPLRIPFIDEDTDTLAAALAYAREGWYVLPVAAGSKNPGSVVGGGWQRQSSRDADQIVAWFAGTDHGIALHCGRSGAVVFDVDNPDRLPALLADNVQETPFQSTRVDTPGRGHYVFHQPNGRTIGNGTGRLGGAWGEVRGLNGVIIAQPTTHPDGGRYEWLQTGEVAELPEALADALDDATASVDAASDAAVSAFLAAHRKAQRPTLVHGWRSALEKRIAAGESRHGAAISVVAGAMKEARAGLISAPAALEVLRPIFLEAVSKPPTSTKQGQSRRGTQAASEWAGIVAWAVGQALASNLDEVHARANDRMPASNTTITPHEVPPSATEDEELDAAAIYARKVAAELDTLRIRDEARRLLAAEKAAEGAAAIPQPITLAELLAQPDEDAEYRIDGLLPRGARALLAAQYKAGKSTMVANLLRTLVDGETFLGRFSTERAQRVALLDDELDMRMLRRWLRDQNIARADAVTVHSLRGKVSSFNILDPEIRSRWAQLLAGADVVILDCLRPVLDALGLDENKDAGRFLVAFDELLAEAGASEAVVVHHMGHSGERSRGDSRLLDWPDVLWKIVRERGDNDENAPEAARYFSAYGRDVDVREGKLDYHHETRALTYGDTNRKQSAVGAVLPDIAEILTAAPEGLSGRALCDALGKRGHAQHVAREAVKLAQRDGVTYTTLGARNAQIHRLTPPSVSVRQSVSPVRQHGGDECVSASIETHTHSLHTEPLERVSNTLPDDAPQACVVCGHPFLLPQPGKTICAIRDEAHNEARRTAA